MDKNKKLSKEEQKKQETKKDLLDYYIKPDTTLLIVIKSVSKSGMSRRMRVLTDDLSDITYLVGRLLGLNYKDYTGLLITGCGMDMTFWLADAITHELYGHDQEIIKKLNFKGNGGSCLNWETV